MRAVNTARQRGHYGRALYRDPQTPLPTIADIMATVYRVWVAMGSGTQDGMLVLAANEKQARVHAALRLEHECFPPCDVVRVDTLASDSPMSKASILSHEAPTEFSARQDFYKASEAEKAPRCPSCDSPSPRLHPAVQHEGEVQICRNPWHGPLDERMGVTSGKPTP